MSRFIQSRMLFGLVLTSLFLSFLSVRYFSQRIGQDCDFLAYYFGAQVVDGDRHADLYQGATDRNAQTIDAPADSPIAQRARAAGIGSIMQYIYPPLLADLLIPLSRLPVATAITLWRSMNLIFFLLAMWMLARLLRISPLSLEFAVLVMGGYCLQPMHSAMFFGQISLFLLVLWVVGIRAFMDGRMLLSAFVLALATALKLTPLMIVPVFLIWRERRWLLGYFGTLLALVAAMAAWNGPLALQQCAAAVAAMGEGFPALENKSISSLVAWVYHGHLLGYDAVYMQSHLQNWIIRILSGGFYLACMALIWRRRWLQEPAERTITLSLFVLVLLCVSPISWNHAYTVAIIPFSIYWVDALHHQRPTSHIVLLTMASIFSGTIFCDHLTNAPLPQPVKILLAGAWVLSVMFFCLSALRLSIRPELQPVEADRRTAG